MLENSKMILDPQHRLARERERDF